MIRVGGSMSSISPSLLKLTFTSKTRLCQILALLDWQVRCQFFGQPWRSCNTRCTDKLFFPKEILRAGIFCLLALGSAGGMIYNIYQPKTLYLFSPRQALQSFKTGKREVRPLKTWECWTCEPTPSLPWEKLKARGSLFLIIWCWAGSRYPGGRVSQISLLASVSLVSYSPQV